MWADGPVRGAKFAARDHALLPSVAYVVRKPSIRARCPSSGTTSSPRPRQDGATLRGADPRDGDGQGSQQVPAVTG